MPDTNLRLVHHLNKTYVSDAMNELHDRINRVINTHAFESRLEQEGIDFAEFQCSWRRLSRGDFENLPEGYKAAILAGERESHRSGELVLG